MKKIICLLSVLVLSLTVAACGGKSDEEAVNEALGVIIINVDRLKVEDDFYLTRVVMDNEVKVVWASDNAAIKIEKETLKLAEDTEAHEYYKAVVTRPSDADAVAKLTATLTKGKVSKVWEETYKVIVDTSLFGTVAETKARQKNDLVRVKATVNYRGVLSTQYKNFSAYIQDDTGAMYVYRLKGDFYDRFAVGNEVEITGKLDDYNGLLQVKDVTVAKLRGTKTAPVAVDISGVAQTDLLQHQSKLVKMTGEYFISASTDGKKVFLNLTKGTTVIAAVADVDHLPGFDATKPEALLALNGKVCTSIEGVLSWYKAGQIMITDTAKIVTRDATPAEKLEMDTINANADLEALKVASKTSNNLTLPVTGKYGSAIAWVSDTPASLSNAGVVVQGAADVTVKLTATIVLGATTLIKHFTVVVEKIVTEQPAVNHVIINEVYGGGGNTGAPFTHDFVELYNPTDADINISGWMIQYASTTGVFKAEAATYADSIVFPENSIIKAKGYFLIQFAAGSGTTMPGLPEPDLIADTASAIAMAGKGGKIVLLNTNVKISDPTHASVVDFLGCGGSDKFEGAAAGPVIDNKTSASRVDFADTDNNGADFIAGEPTPQNSKSTDK